MQMNLKLPGFLGRKKKGAVSKVEKSEVKAKSEFPEITETELKKHVGKHVAIVKGKIAASAGTASRALTMAKQKHSGKEITLRYVGKGRLLINCKCIEKS